MHPAILAERGLARRRPTHDRRHRPGRRPARGPRFSLKAAWTALARGDIALGLGVLAIIVVLLMPMPPWLLDVLLAVSIITSVMILMVALFIKEPLEFSSFPTVLLIATLLRLALNIASTRLILSHGHEGRRRPAPSSKPSAAS